MTSASTPTGLPAPTAEQRREAALHFDHASNLIATGSPLAGIRRLLDCCRLDPANLLYRQALRRAEKARFGNNLRGSRFAWLVNWRTKRQLRKAKAAGKYLEALDLGERVLIANPWDVPTQLEMAHAAEVLGLLDVAVWTLEQARQKEAYDPDLNRGLARLYEQRGNFTQALALWELVTKAAPQDEEARRKLASANRSSATHLDEPVRVALERLRGEPLTVAAYLDVVRLYRQGQQYDAARKVLLDGLAATGNAFDLTVELADLEIEPFRRDLVLTRQKRGEQLDEPWLRQIEQDLGREINTRELELYRLLADRYPARLVNRYEVGVRLLRAGQIAEAIEEFRGVRGDAELHGLSLVALAEGYRGRHNLRQALRYFEEALACLPTEPAERRKEVLYELARCHAELGELPRALSVGTELQRLDPGHRDIGHLLHVWQTSERAVHPS